MKHSVALRDCIFREPFPGNLTVTHINRRFQKSSMRGTTISNSKGKKKNHATNFINIVIILVPARNCLLEVTATFYYAV